MFVEESDDLDLEIAESRSFVDAKLEDRVNNFRTSCLYLNLRRHLQNSSGNEISRDVK